MKKRAGCLGFSGIFGVLVGVPALLCGGCGLSLVRIPGPSIEVSVVSGGIVEPDAELTYRPRADIPFVTTMSAGFMGSTTVLYHPDLRPRIDGNMAEISLPSRYWSIRDEVLEYAEINGVTLRVVDPGSPPMNFFAPATVDAHGVARYTCQLQGCRVSFPRDVRRVEIEFRATTRRGHHAP